MKIWQLQTSDEFKKVLKRLDQKQKIRIVAFLYKRVLPSGNPRIFGKALTGKLSGYWSYRVGDYRVIADIQDNTLRIIAVSIGHRREIYE